MSSPFVKTLAPQSVDDPQPCYRLEAGSYPALMLRMELRAGASLALPYAHLGSLSLDAETGLTLLFATHKVLLKGRNLQPLYELLARHRVEALREHVTAAHRFPAEATVISSIQLELLT